MTFLVWLLHLSIQCLLHTALDRSQKKVDQSYFHSFQLLRLSAIQAQPPESKTQHRGGYCCHLVKPHGDGAEQEQTHVCDKARASWWSECCNSDMEAVILPGGVCEELIHVGGYKEPKPA